MLNDATVNVIMLNVARLRFVGPNLTFDDKIFIKNIVNSFHIFVQFVQTFNDNLFLRETEERWVSILKPSYDNLTFKIKIGGFNF
jgi:hypothetical protein